ncbi:MAG: hypothetical protein ACKVRN_09240 [Pyrinomonadaceae bacterium]
MELKDIFGVVAIILTFAGYAPYFRDVVRGKTKPHVYSWFLWGFVTFIAAALQISGGAGLGGYVTLTAATMCSTVFVLGYISKGERDITRSDTVFLILGFVALAFWLIAEQPVISMILVTTIDLLGFGPTVRKSWNKPHSETLSFYLLNTFRFALAVMALHTYTIVTAAYPITWAFANGIFGALLLIRRKQLAVSA